MVAKVLFIHSGGGIGGAPVSMLTLAASLDRKLYEPHIVFTEDGPIVDVCNGMGMPASVIKMRGVLVYGAHVPLTLRATISGLVHFIPTIIAAVKLFKEENPDFIHLNTSALLSIGIAARLKRIPIIWHVREVVNPGTLFGSLLGSAICALAYRVIAVSDYVAGCLPKSKKISVIHNSVNTSTFDPIYKDEYRIAINSELGITKKNVLIGILGSVQKEKGHFILVEAAKTINQKFPEVVFLIVGGGAPVGYENTLRGKFKALLRLPLDNLEKLYRRINELKLSQCFKTTGYQLAVEPYVGSMDILVAPNIKPEGCPRSLLEGMAMSIPVVVSDIGPSREIMGDKSAYFCKPGDVLSLSTILISLIESDVMRNQLGDQGRVRALSKFKIENHIEKIQTLYDSVTVELNPVSIKKKVFSTHEK